MEGKGTRHRRGMQAAPSSPLPGARCSCPAGPGRHSPAPPDAGPAASSQTKGLAAALSAGHTAAPPRCSAPRVGVVAGVSPLPLPLTKTALGTWSVCLNLRTCDRWGTGALSRVAAATPSGGCLLPPHPPSLNVPQTRKQEELSVAASFSPPLLFLPSALARGTFFVLDLRPGPAQPGGKQRRQG